MTWIQFGGWIELSTTEQETKEVFDKDKRKLYE